MSKNAFGQTHFKFKGCQICFICCKFTKVLVIWQTVLILVRLRILIWVHTVCQYHTNAFGYINFKFKGCRVCFVCMYVCMYVCMSARASKFYLINYLARNDWGEGEAKRPVGRNNWGENVFGAEWRGARGGGMDNETFRGGNGLGAKRLEFYTKANREDRYSTTEKQGLSCYWQFRKSGVYGWPIPVSQSRKHAYIILTSLNPTFI